MWWHREEEGFLGWDKERVDGKGDGDEDAGREKEIFYSN